MKTIDIMKNMERENIEFNWKNSKKITKKKWFIWMIGISAANGRIKIIIDKYWKQLCVLWNKNNKYWWTRNYKTKWKITNKLQKSSKKMKMNEKIVTEKE